MDLASPSKRLHSHQVDRSRSASHGIRSRVCPAADMPTARPLPDDVAAIVRPSHRQVTRSRSARGLSPLRRFTPCRGLGFVAPQNRPGFIAFRDGHPTRPRPKPQAVEMFHPSAQCGSHPPKNSPRQQPYRVTAAVALLPFGSLTNRPSTEALNRSPCAPTSRRQPPLQPSAEAQVRIENRVVPCASSANHHSLSAAPKRCSEEPGPPAPCSALRPKPSSGEIPFPMSPKRHCSPEFLHIVPLVLRQRSRRPRCYSFLSRSRVPVAAPALRAASRSQLLVPRSHHRCVAATIAVRGAVPVHRPLPKQDSIHRVDLPECRQNRPLSLEVVRLCW
jgi:hypothetical protein